MSSTPRTVVVTGANSRTGRDLLPLVSDPNVRVTALVRTPEDLPADEVVPDWTRSPRAVEVIANASVVVHLSGVFAAPDLDTYEAGNVASTRRVVDSIHPAARLIYVSYVGADSAHDNWYIRTKGQAEDLVNSVSDSVIFRVHPMVGGHDDPRPFELMLRQKGPDAPVRVMGDGTQQFRPVHAADVIDAIVRATHGLGKAGTYDLVGPSDLTIEDMAEKINGYAVPIDRVPIDRVAVPPGPPATVVDLLANPTRSSDPDTVARIFELTLTRPETGWPIAGPVSS
ncbi:sugar nucleotide-binding protein [Streptomyces sp. NBC_01537]|uniref:SDR family oxidoreductase n=1 Tax=Streptomyces sp. NBC_01537 TaxID=2903896 RepID=UPI00386F19E6